MSVCLTSKSCQRKKNAGKLQGNIKNTYTFLVHALINHIMVSELPPDCPPLPDGHVLMAALVGMDKDRFSSMFLDGIQVRCASGSSCNIHTGADSVEKSLHRCMNCALKFHLCITCSGSCFGDWYLVLVKGKFSKSMLSEYGQKKYDQYSDDHLSSPLEMCLYCKSSLSLSMDALCSSNSATTTLAKASGDTTLAKASGNTTLVKASGNDHGGTANNSVPCADTDDIMGVVLSSEQHYRNSNNSLRILVVMCRCIKTNDGSEIVDFNVDPWMLLKVTTYCPSLLEWRSEVRQRLKINIATKRISKLSKKDNPLPNQWTIPKCQKWLDLYPISVNSDIAFLCAKIQVQLDIVAKAVEQNKSEEQKLWASNDGNNWYGNDPILCLIYTLDETEIRRAYMNRHDLSNKRVVLGNAKLVEKREETVWEKMASMWNNEIFFPLTMELSPILSTHFVVSRGITFNSCSELTAATPEKCANKFSTMLVELQRLIGLWSLSGKGDEDLDGHTADEDNFGSLHCFQGALDSRANFLGTSQLYILYLWEFLDAHDLLRTSFQRLNGKVAARNGRKGVPPIIQSGKAKPSTLGTNKTKNSPASGFNDDRTGNSIQLPGESNIRVACIKSNAAERNTLHNLLFNLRTQKRQMVVERLKAMSVFDNPLAESLGEQIEEIDVEIKECTAKLDSIMGAEMTTPLIRILLCHAINC